MYFVLMVFNYGLLLLVLQVQVFSLFSMIVYIGAVTILFAFMVLFVNAGHVIYTEEERLATQEWKVLYVSLSVIIGLLYFYTLYSVAILTGVSLNPTSFGGVENLTSLAIISELLYSTNGGVLCLMMWVMAMGLFLVIKLVKNTNKTGCPEHRYNEAEFKLVQHYLQGRLRGEDKKVLAQAEYLIKTKGLKR